MEVHGNFTAHLQLSKKTKIVIDYRAQNVDQVH